MSEDQRAYEAQKRKCNIAERKLNKLFKKAFPLKSEVLFRRQYNGRLYVGIVMRQSAYDRHRSLDVVNQQTGKRYWVDASWLEKEQGGSDK